MSTEHTITKRAALGALTVAELREFLAEFRKVYGEQRAQYLARKDGIS